MFLPFIDREPSEIELERFRLVLSNYQSDTDTPNPITLSSDFMRTIAAVFQGNMSTIGSEFDILLRKPDSDTLYGIDCKIRRVTDLNKPNSMRLEITFRLRRDFHFPYNLSATETGSMLLEAFQKQLYMHNSEIIDYSKSIYLFLFFDTKGQYQLAQLPYGLLTSENLQWEFSDSHLRGIDNNGSTLSYRAHSPTPLIYRLGLKSITWVSKIFHLEPLSALRNMEFGVQTKIQLSRQSAIEKLKKLIEANALESEFQTLLKENPWMFGSEYAKLLDRRVWIRDKQQDFMLKRTADGFLEMIEIKRPLNSPLFYEDDSHKTLYSGPDLSKALGQVIGYLEELDSDRHRIRSKDGEDVGKIRAKLIIGRDRDEKQVEALRNLNSHINRIEILTFDQLLRIAARILEYA